MSPFVVRLPLITVLAVMASLPSQARLGSPMHDAHNCYSENGEWADRLPRALGTGRRPIGVEQDLVWKPDGPAGGTSVVGHDATLTGSEPTLEDYFFTAVSPAMDAALAADRRETWPLIVLHFDFKTNEPEHHRFVLALLRKYERWLTTSIRGRNDSTHPLKVGPMMVLTEAGENQQRDFYDSLPVGSTMLIFGTVPTVSLTDSRDRDTQANASIAASPAVLLPSGATNYRRWANFSWAVVERGGQTRAGEWTVEDRARLDTIVSRAHALGLWLRFYTLDGFTARDNRGWSDSYNFGSLDAARARWRAAIAAGVDFIASDQYERLAEILR